MLRVGMPGLELDRALEGTWVQGFGLSIEEEQSTASMRQAGRGSGIWRRGSAKPQLPMAPT